MMLRRMMLRRKTDPKTGNTLCARLRNRKACPRVTRNIRRATFYRNLQAKCRRPQPRRRLCASQRSRNTCQDFTRATCHFIRKFTGQMPRPKTAPQTCARSRIACQHLTRTTLLHTEIYKKNAAAQTRAADLVRACAVETHVKISQEEPLYAKIYK